METYNGWTNWDTWAIALWADNEEIPYRHKRAMLEQIGKYQDKGRYAEAKARAGLLRIAKEAARYARNQGEPIDNKAVNWKEIVDEWLADWEAEKKYREKKTNH